MKERLQDFFKNRKRRVLTLIFGPVIASLIIGCLAALADPGEAPYIGFLCMCLAYPIELFIINIVALILAVRFPERLLPGTYEEKLFGIMDLVTVMIGTVLSILYSALIQTFMDLRWDAVWSEQLHNREVHQPIWSGALPTVIILFAIGVMGYIVLLTRKMSDTPPLITVLCMGAMYIGISQILLFMIQIFKITPFEGLAYSSDRIPFFELLPLMELPFCLISMSARLILRKIYEWNQEEEHHTGSYGGEGFMAGLNGILANSFSWPIAAIIVMIPLLGMILGVLSLIGQYPDHVIRAWTETAQWNFSKMQAPPNVQFDEHYLCTVAAGGHERVVKPIRMGERHGHRIVVNRQLLIANAFEQILEEKTPGMHRVIRKFYDTHGYPIARHIKTRTAADMVYVIMKPLEWLFLLVLYLTDPAPENRIAVQYMPAGELNGLQS